MLSLCRILYALGPATTAHGKHHVQHFGVAQKYLKIYDAKDLPIKTRGYRCQKSGAKNSKQTGRGLRKQDMKTFLREVVIVGQDFRQPFAAHHLHGDAIGEAVFLVGARLVQGQPVKK